jgi:CubicO group peptidase (beta-lactamase class C family)
MSTDVWRQKVKRRAILSAAVVLLAAAAADAAPRRALPPAKAAALPAAMKGFVDRGVIAGAVTLIDRGGEVAVAAVGKRDLSSGEAMREDDLFWIASMTKPMAAAAVAMLKDEGKLAFDDPVEKHLPEFRGQWMVQEETGDRRVLVRPPRAITIRDLLIHASGLGDVPSPRPHATLAELSMAYAREPLRFSPGERWTYSNAGINVLGRIVEVASGQRFEEFFQARLLTPLGMRDTTFWPTPEQARRVATAYGPPEGALQPVRVEFYKGELTDRARTPLPAGGLYSTARDVGRFYRMMLRGGTLDGRVYLKPETAAELSRTQSGDLQTGFVPGMSWGYGFQVVREPQGVTAALSPGTFGHGGAYATQSWADPRRDLVMVLMIQRAGFKPNGDSAEIRKVFNQLAEEAAR